MLRAAAFVIVLLVITCECSVIHPDDSFLRGSNEHCDDCTTRMTDLMSFFSSNSSMEHLEDVLQKVCLLLDRDLRAKCREIVSSVVESLEDLDEKLIEKHTPVQLCNILGFCQNYCCSTPFWPQEVHISLGSNPQSMWVVWVTQLETSNPTVKYGTDPNQLNLSNNGITQTYYAGGWNGFIYVAEMTNLKPSTEYYYQVGDPDTEWSRLVYSFISAPTTETTSSTEVNFVAYGDMDSTSASSPVLYWLQQYAYAHNLDYILHMGDISYADGYQPGWDIFLQKLEPVASQIPYMVTAGNHEEFFDFTAYRYRFKMPVPEDNLQASRANMTLYYSFNYANTHVIALSFESFWGIAPNLHEGKAQYEWLKNDLIHANLTRSQRPWIFVFCHRPLYCANNNGNRCEGQARYYRSLVEDLLYEYKVDIVFTGHVHDYERTLPVYQSMVSGNVSVTDKVFYNPTAPIYSVIGTGGTRESLNSNFADPPPPWTVPSSHLAEFGYTHVNIKGSTLHWEFRRASDNKAVDSFSIVKN